MVWKGAKERTITSLWIRRRRVSLWFGFNLVGVSCFVRGLKIFLSSLIVIVGCIFPLEYMLSRSSEVQDKTSLSQFSESSCYEFGSSAWDLILVPWVTPPFTSKNPDQDFGNAAVQLRPKSEQVTGIFPVRQLFRTSWDDSKQVVSLVTHLATLLSDVFQDFDA